MKYSLTACVTHAAHKGCHSPVCTLHHHTCHTYTHTQHHATPTGWLVTQAGRLRAYLNHILLEASSSTTPAGSVGEGWSLPPGLLEPFPADVVLRVRLQKGWCFVFCVAECVGVLGSASLRNAHALSAVLLRTGRT